MWSSILLLLWAAGSARAATKIAGISVNVKAGHIDKGEHPVVASPDTYYPDLHDCPLTCSDYSNVNAWTTYFSLDRLDRCPEPMLLQFSVSQLLDDPDTTVLLRACTLGSPSARVMGFNGTMVSSHAGAKFSNPKKNSDLFEAALKTAPACAVSGKRTEVNVQVSTKSGKGSRGDVARLLAGMQAFFADKDNCNEKVIFGYHQRTVAGVYIGAGLGKPTVASALTALKASLTSKIRAVAQVCDEIRNAERAFGVSVDNSLPSLQKTIIGWTKGGCFKDRSMKVTTVRKVSISDIKQAGLDQTSAGKVASSSSSTTKTLSSAQLQNKNETFDKRATCQYRKVVLGDECPSLASKCGISGADFEKYNSWKQNLCSSLREGDYVCCSAGDPYIPPKPAKPVKNSDGTCATHFITTVDTCDDLAKANGLTTADIEGFNKGKTWAWTECRSMLAGYNMCLSDGDPPLPPPQQGAECGPVRPGTTRKSGMSLVDYNPCPLKACCSNWGFCGPFPAHCEIHAPAGAGPGAKLKEYGSTCISNCGQSLLFNSGPPATFQRIGYYSSWNLGRTCLWLNAKNANTDGTYTHMHWGFAEIDPNGWKVVLKDPHGQWNDFKKLDAKRIVSFGGWAYSTEPATYNIIRQAIINNRDLFATNVAQFVRDEGIDGVDIDWEYPGAPDIYVDGKPIGQAGDGIAYLTFLGVLKSKLKDKSVSIAAPASHWYLKAFPIAAIASVVDYIVYMTYDLHGQWDYGNPNSFDACPSGKCIRSHVNLTETLGTLTLITKAGVPNNKIYVGEASYGRTFRMATNGCWGPLCDFTGTRYVSNANPGRCTGVSGFLGNAEINEILAAGRGTAFYDKASDTDILLYDGDYVSYMTPTTKETRRSIWKAFNFAGSVDWALDLQGFGNEDLSRDSGAVDPGQEGCIFGRDREVDSKDLCAFACSFDFCPEAICECRITGTVPAMPNFVEGEFIAWDDFDVDMNRLCKFACSHGYCPPEVCTQPVVDEDADGSDIGIGAEADAKAKNAMTCLVYKDFRKDMALQCEQWCRPILDQARDENRISNYGCVGNFPIDQPIPWVAAPGTGALVQQGNCVCDSWVVNYLAETIIDALPIIAQIGCYILMSSFKFVLDIALDLVPGGAGRALDAGMDMAAVAAQTIAYLYPESEKPAEAFNWWLSPCGGTDLVPDEVKQVFDILQTISTPNFKTPKLAKGSGRKGDGANPTNQSRPKGGTGAGPNGTGKTGKVQKKCKIPPGRGYRRMGEAQNTIMREVCAGNPQTTQKNAMVIHSVNYAQNARRTTVRTQCHAEYSQACQLYSSAIRNHPNWAELVCPDAAGTAKNNRLKGKATAVYKAQHNGKGWMQYPNREEKLCDMDEYPPIYLLGPNDPAFYNGGVNDQGQVVRYLPATENRAAGGLWKGACFTPIMDDMNDAAFEKKHQADQNPRKLVKTGTTYTMAKIDYDLRPVFSIDKWEHKVLPDDGMADNRCWPSKKAPNDAGFPVLTFDPWYKGVPPPYNYRAAIP